VSLVTTDSYVVGALVLGHSLRDAGVAPGRRLVCMVTPTVSACSRAALQGVFSEVVEVERLDSNDAKNLSVLGRPDLGQSVTKLNVWRLSGVKKAVFLDADVLVLRSMEQLFEWPELSACPDVGWPDCFNSGVFVCEPRQETFDSLMKHLREVGSFDGICRR
jgi:glycogenin glucosyltransferase